MNVLYVSKALAVAAYRDKLRALGEHARVRAIIPHRWGSQPIEPIEPPSYGDYGGQGRQWQSSGSATGAHPLSAVSRGPSVDGIADENERIGRRGGAPKIDDAVAASIRVTTVGSANPGAAARPLARSPAERLTRPRVQFGRNREENPYGAGLPSQLEEMGSRIDAGTAAGPPAADSASEAPRVRIDTCRTLFHGWNHLHFYWGLGRILERLRPDLVHIDEEPYSAAAFQLAILCSRRGIPCTFFAWQNLHKRLPPPFRAMRSTVFRRVAGAIAGTDTAADVLLRAGYGGPLAVIPQFGVDPGRFRPDPRARSRQRAQLGLAEDDFLIGFVGRLVKEKGVYLLLSPLEQLPTAHLMIVGNGPERERLERAVLNAAVSERVHFVGSVPSGQVAGLLPALDVLVLPSLTGPSWAEQFGRILVEAMACGVPVVGSDSGEIPRVIGDSGHVFPEGDIRALRSCLEGLAASPGARTELGLKGRERVLALYTQERIAARTADFYRILLAERR